MYDVTALGELLIDFTPSGISESGMRLFEQNPGGAPANVLTALAKFGMNTAFIGKVGCDIHGDFLRETLEKQNIDIKGLITDSNVFTTLTFVELSESGERSFSFARKPGADTCLKLEEVNTEILTNTKIFHFGSLSLTNQPSRSATMHAIEVAKKAGAIISYDPNYRALLWSSKKEAIMHMQSVLSYVDVIKISDEETKLITDHEDPMEASKRLINMGISVVVVTLGSKGALIRTKQTVLNVKSFKCNVIDTTGAGDSFWGGFLYKLVKSNVNPKQLSASDAEEFVIFANKVASICVEKRGAIPAMPTLKEVEDSAREISYE